MVIDWNKTPGSPIAFGYKVDRRSDEGAVSTDMGLLLILVVTINKLSNSWYPEELSEDQLKHLGCKCIWIYSCIYINIYVRLLQEEKCMFRLAPVANGVILAITTQQGVPGDAVPWPEREAPSLPSLFLRLPPQAAPERYLSS